jgi:hypothetical protein
MSLRVLIPLTLLSLGVTLVACGDKDTDDTGPEGDTDTDTDADSDTDADADADADTDVEWPSSFAGAVEYVFVENGVNVCDATIDLAGTKYTGTCADCDFAFDIDPTVSRDDGQEGCYLHPYFSYMEQSVYAGLMMAHMDSYMGYYGTYNDVFATGFAIDYSAYGWGYYPGPYFFMLAYDGNTLGSFTRTGDDIEWSWYYAGYDTTYTYDYLADCGSSVSYSDLGGAVNSMFYGSSDMDCDGATVDVWTIDVPTGTAVEVSVDTVAADTAFDPRMWISDSDECIIAYSDDAFDCTFPPPTYQCPATTWTTTEAGLYHIVVASYGDCAGTDTMYEVAVGAGGADPNLTLIQDNATLGVTTEKTTYAYDISGSGTITP